jgi:hypothetical protein
MPSPMSSKGIERPIAVVNTEFAAVGSAQGPSKPLQTTTAGLQTISSATHRRRRGPWPPDPPPSPPRRRRSPAVAEETPAPKRHWRHADAPERARLQLASARPHLWADVEDYPTPLPVEGRHAVPKVIEVGNRSIAVKLSPPTDRVLIEVDHTLAGGAGPTWRKLVEFDLPRGLQGSAWRVRRAAEPRQLQRAPVTSSRRRHASLCRCSDDDLRP